MYIYVCAICYVVSVRRRRVCYDTVEVFRYTFFFGRRSVFLNDDALLINKKSSEFRSFFFRVFFFLVLECL